MTQERAISLSEAQSTEHRAQSTTSTYLIWQAGYNKQENYMKDIPEKEKNQLGRDILITRTVGAPVCFWNNGFEIISFPIKDKVKLDKKHQFTHLW